MNKRAMPSQDWSDCESEERSPQTERAFIEAVASQLVRTSAELDAKSSVVASHVSRQRPVNQDLLAALQSFDRLEQELGAMAEILGRFATLADDRSVQAIDSIVLSSIRLTDLKLRIVQAWRGGNAPLPPHQSDYDSEDELF